MSSKLLALDQSSKISGYAIFENEQLIKYGKFNFTDSSVGKRINQLRKSVENLIKDYQITEIVMEDIQMQNNLAGNVQTFKVLAQVQGALIDMCQTLGIDYTITPSVTWKSGLGIKGRQRSEQKKNAQLFVQQKFDIKATQDECDAICIGWQHILR